MKLTTKSSIAILFFSLFMFFSISGYGQSNSIEVYGFIMADAGFDINTTDPLWFDVLRTTKLPAFSGQFDPEGKTYWGVRQTRFGVKSNTPTKAGNIFTQFEWELFGVGVDAGQTTLRLRHAYGQIGKFGAGQYWSPFMDIDVFPNSIEYWGPPGMVFFRNVQVRFMPIMQKDSKLTLALERPGASGDAGIYADRIEIQDVEPQFYFPDFSADYRYTGDFGYIEVAGILRHIRWVDTRADTLSLDGTAIGWGANLSSNLNITKNDVLKLQGVYGEGIENYMNDATVDIGVDTNFSGRTTRRPIKGVALPLFGVVAFLDHTWSKHFTSSVGYSIIDIDNTDLTAGTTFKRGQYALANVLYYPYPNVMAGVEYQWGERENENKFKSHDHRVQFSFRYNFSKLWNW